MSILLFLYKTCVINAQDYYSHNIASPAEKRKCSTGCTGYKGGVSIPTCKIINEAFLTSNKLHI